VTTPADTLEPALAAWSAPQGAIRAALILGHGAGGDHRAKLLAELAERLPARGIAVARFDFTYRRAGKKLPDPMPRLEATYQRAIEEVVARAPAAPVFVGGKSMGGRVASHLAAQGLACAGLVLLGYPLHPAGKKEKLRDAHLPKVTVPMLFVQGTRDDLCDLDLLRPVLATCGDRPTLHVVADGNHSLEVRKLSGRTNAQALDEVEETVAAFVLSNASSRIG
jgi:hypothetical protein